MRKTHHVAAALAVGILASGAASATSAAPAAADDSGCTVASGSLTWGVKESFRSYISGSIAQGEWTASDGASYSTPEFTFDGATGHLDPDTGDGSVSFPGTVHFTGHGGILDMTLASPRIVISDGSAVLHLDVRGTDTSGEPAVDEQQAEVGAIGQPITVDIAAGTASVTDAPVTLTEAGAPAFGGFYAAGDDLDPVTVDVRLDCMAPETTAPADADGRPADAEEEPGAQAADDADTAWVPFAVGGGVVLAAAAAAGTLIARRRR